MDTLNTYRDNLSKNQDNYSKDYPHSFSFQEGFDAAIDLQLSIKYQTWLRKHKWFVDGDGKWYSTEDRGNYSQPAPRFTEEQLYKYWSENIYQHD